MVKSLAEMAAEVQKVNESKGWYDEDRTFGEAIALLHSEVSEALEAWRKWGFRDATDGSDEFIQGGHVAKPEGVGSEFADILIRLLDECARQGIDLEFEYERKLAFNRTRPYKHGGRAI